MWDSEGWRSGDRGARRVPLERATEPGGSAPAWLAHLPLALLVLAGAAIGGITLLRILGGVGRARVAELAVPPGTAPAVVPALEEVVEPYLQRWIEGLSAVELGGRDTPSVGLDRAQEWVAAEFREIGLVPLERFDDETPPSRLDRPLVDETLEPFLHPFRASAAFFGRVPYENPEPSGNKLVRHGTAHDFRLGVDFVPMARSSREDPVFRGTATGDLVFAGYGIDSETWDYDDFRDLDVRGKVALILSGEPEGGAFEGRFEDEEVSAEACLWNKLDALAREGAAGALVVDLLAAERPLEYRWTRAYWNPPTMDKVRGGLPTLRLSVAAGEALLGESPLVVAQGIRASGEPVQVGLPAGSRVTLSAATERGDVQLRNVVGEIPAGPDGRYLVIGAHLDHIGVGPRGRVGSGADDNATGVAALLGVARALHSEDGRARLGGLGVLFCAFTGEEDGRVGSHMVATGLQGLGERAVAMINLDMVGRGPEASAVLFGLAESSVLRGPVERAIATGAHGFERIREVTSASFFKRSDHYEFYQVGIPALFLFEDWPHLPGIYHTWRDTEDLVSVPKVASMARLAALVAFELAR